MTLTMNSRTYRRHAATGLLGLSLLCPAAAGAATFHVAPGGNDANPGSAERPWRSLEKANQTLRAGDTVLLHAGRYAQALRPVNDGEADDRRIVYRAFGDGDVIITGFRNTDAPDGGALALGGKRYVTVSGRAAGDPADTRRIKLEPQVDVGMLGNACGATGIVVENIYARCPDDARSCSRGFAFCLNYWGGDHESKFNVLRNSVLIGHSSVSNDASDYTEDLVTLAHRAHHNVIENNVLENVRHSVLYADSPLSHSNVIRNNVIRNPQHTALSIWSAGVGLADGARFLVENNHLEAAGKTQAPHGGPGSPLQWGSDELIIRHNVLTQAGGADQQHATVAGLTAATSTSYGAPYFATDGRVYNNTIVKNRGVGIGVFDFGVDPVDLGRHVFVNNIVYGSDSPHTGQQLVLYWDDNFATGDRYVRNVFGNPGAAEQATIANFHHGATKLSDAAVTFNAPSDPNFAPWAGFGNVDDPQPGFVDYANDDYRLSPFSRYVDGGAPLTRVAAADTGSGTRLVLEDSRFFYAEAAGFPAWMGVEQEWIAVGQDFANAARVKLIAVDDGTASVTLAVPIARRPGDFVWLWRDSDASLVAQGAAPDIGAYETPDRVELDPPSNFRFAE